MRLTIVQYAGDYREAWRRFERGGCETYQAQRYSVGFVGSLAARLERVSVVCAVSDCAYDEVLGNGVHAVGAGFAGPFALKELVPIVARTDPDHLVLTTPSVPILKWARKKGLRSLATFADSFCTDGLLGAFRHRALAGELNRPSVSWIGNHGIGACLSLRQIGVSAEKIIPWDWPPSHRPSDHSPRAFKDNASFQLIYVGSVVPSKGVADLLRALAILRQSGETVCLTVVGKGDDDGGMKQLAGRLGLSDEVDFAGAIPNEKIPAAMRAADAVVIPSRHEYPEGLPLTIYEALASRTPIIASDHPMFRGALEDGVSALTFPAGDFEALAATITLLRTNADTYTRLSVNSEQTWHALQLPVTWGCFVTKWLSNESDDREWLASHRLNSGLYDDQIARRSVPCLPGLERSKA
jgi:glycosyltransferase involved in cell wall biosynthesis